MPGPVRNRARTNARPLAPDGDACEQADEGHPREEGDPHRDLSHDVLTPDGDAPGALEPFLRHDEVLGRDLGEHGSTTMGHEASVKQRACENGQVCRI